MEGKEYVQANHKQIYWTILQIKGKILKLLDRQSNNKISFCTIWDKIQRFSQTLIEKMYMFFNFFFLESKMKLSQNV